MARAVTTEPDPPGRATRRGGRPAGAGTPAAALRPPPERISYGEFLDRRDEDIWVEWVDGEVVPMSPISKRHQDVLIFLLSLLQYYLDANPGGRLCCEPFQMKTGPDLPGRAPDILFVAKENLARLHATYLEGPADMVVEIVSPESAARDRGEKFFEYEKGGVREYWLIDPHRRQAEFHVLGPGGTYRPILVDENGIFRSEMLPGLWLKVEWLWQEPLPPLLQVLREWGLIAT